MDIVTPQQFRTWLVQYSGFDRPDLTPLLTGTSERMIRFAGGRYNPSSGEPLDLRRVQFKYCKWLAGPLWPGLQAQDSHWIGCHIPGADFSRANLSSSPDEDSIKTLFRLTNLPQVKFVEANLNRVRFQQGSSYQGQFQNAQALGSVWEDWRFGDWDNLPERESFTDLSGVDFSWSHLTNCDFRRCVLNGTNFEGCVFENCDFRAMVRGSQITFKDAIDKNGLSHFPGVNCCVDGYQPPARYQ
jgi:uncharacterized protein YjbI with pentapeptide repeats